MNKSALMMALSLGVVLSAVGASHAEAMEPGKYHFSCPGKDIGGPDRLYVYESEVGDYGVLKTESALKAADGQQLGGANPFSKSASHVVLSFDLYGHEAVSPSPELSAGSFAIITIGENADPELSLMGFVGPGSGRSYLSCRLDLREQE